jgi:two-component system, sensor histidine kinase YesM
MVTYSLIMLIPFLIFSTYLITTESQKINSRTFAALRQNCVSLTESMEREIKQMNLVSLNIAYSSLIRDAYNNYLVDQNDYEKTKALNELIANSIGPNRLVDQANLHSGIGTVIASGLYNGTYNYPIEQMPWYEAAKNNNGSKVLSYEGEDPYISKYTTDEYGKHFLSLSRKYYGSYNNVLGYIEVKKSVRQVLSQAVSYKSVSGELVLVFDGYGKMIYPDGVDESKYRYVSDHIAGSDPSTDFIRISDGKSYNFVTFTKSDDGILTAIVISENALFMPTNSYILSVILLTIISLVLAFFLSYFAANRITVPINRIYREMQHISLDGYMTKTSLNTRTIELNVLYDSFIDMQHKLVDSQNKQLLLKNQEMQSKMLALQSQMNPHFLFNSLQTIQSMADANMDKEIIVMCQSMSNILRYISSDAETTVSLSDEITYTQDYLVCMSIRYNHDLFYTIDIPDEMNRIKVPKLCIQPLVENAVKFCATKLPPYRIDIKGSICDSSYLVTVTDNGPGFSSKSLSMIRSKIKEIDSTGLLPSLEIKGMGLLNIYLRFKILYGSNTVFRIENLQDGGASITVGGPYDK